MDYARVFKALSDPNRLKILEILSCGDRCACDIQAYFSLSQPTLSHHMKALVESGLVSVKKVGHWHHYHLNGDNADTLIGYLKDLMSDTENCLCHEVPVQKACEPRAQGRPCSTAHDE